MKVVMTIRSQSSAPGGFGVPGGQIGMIQIARALGRLGIDVDLFVGGPRMDYLDGLADVKPIYFPWPARLDRFARTAPPVLRQVTLRFRRRRWLEAVVALAGVRTADVIHVQGLKDAELLLTRLSGPLVVTHWGRVGQWRSDDLGVGMKAELERRLTRLRDNAVLVAIGETQATEMTSVGLSPKAVVLPGIDTEHFKTGSKAKARRLLALADDNRIVLYVGRLAADKNVATLLKAFARIPHGLQRNRLLVVGDGPLQAELQELSTTLGIKPRTTFLRFVPHQVLPLYYQAADVAVVPSDRLETFCMVGLEAIACGCPLIVTEQVPEIIKRYPDVAVTSPHDVDGLCRRLCKALSADQRPPGSSMTSVVSWDEIAHQYLDLYQSARRPALDPGSPRRRT